MPISIIVISLVSLIIHFVPGHPVDQIIGDYATKADKDLLKQQLGLDRDIFSQIVQYFKNLTQLDLGISLINNRPVTELILERLPATIQLALISILCAIFMSIPLGILSAIKQKTFIDNLAMLIALTGVAIPNFFFGPALILVFSVYLGWLPVSEKESWLSYILPSVTMGTALAAMLSRMTRNSILETIKSDYVRTAKSKGLSYWFIIYKHVLKNASLPIITTIGLQFGALLTGAIITEKIFDWPGIGTLMLEAIKNRDYPIIQGCILTFSFSYLLINLLTDIICTQLDPRIKISSSGVK